MSVKQLIGPANRAFTSNGFPAPGATVSLYLSGTLTPANFYADTGLVTPLGPALTADGAGRFETPAYQDEFTAFRIIYRDAGGVQLDDIDPFFFGYEGPRGPQGIAGDVAKVATIADLAATPVGGQPSGLTRYVCQDGGRNGVFVWSTADLSVLVAADTEQGVYVAPASGLGVATNGSDGAWVRQFDGAHNVKWFGATGDGVTNDAAAIQAALDYLRDTALAGYAFSSGSSRLFLPRGVYLLGSTSIDVQHTVYIFGEGTGDVGGAATVLKSDDGHTSLRLQAWNTSGDGTVGDTGYKGADGSCIDGIHFQGGYTLSESAGGHGILMRAKSEIRNCHLQTYSGNGIHIDATSGAGVAGEGNANGWRVDHCFLTNCTIGLYINGDDANAGHGIDINTADNRQWGIYDSSFLGNFFSGGEHATNGYRKVLSNSESWTPSLVSYNGNWYGPVLGQEAGASTNAPSGDTTDNTYWYYVFAGAPNTTNWNVPAWTSGITVRTGGPFAVDNANASSKFAATYCESDQAPVQLSVGSLFIGSPACRVIGALISATANVASSQTALAVRSASDQNTISFYGSGDDATNGLVSAFNSGYGGAGALSFGVFSGNLLYFTTWRGNLGPGFTPFVLSTEASSATEAPWGKHRLNFPNGFGHYGKKRESAVAMPTSGDYTLGDFVDNNSYAITGSAGSQYVVLGWGRLTTGSSHVLNTDWFEARVLTGT